MREANYESALAAIETGVNSAMTSLRKHLELAPDRAPIKAAIEAVQETLSHCRARTFEVAVVGVVKAGKSTLVNAMVFGEEVLPAASVPCTAKLSVIRSGPKRQGTARMMSQVEWSSLERLAAAAAGPPPAPDDSAEGIAADTVEQARSHLGELRQLFGTEQTFGWPDLEQYAAAKPRGALKSVKKGKFTPIVATLNITGPLPRPWDKGIVFVDTPGLNDPVRSREEETNGYLAKASAVVLLLYAGAPFGAADAKILAQRLVPVGFEKIVIAINKMDTKHPDDRDKVTDYVSERIHELTRMLEKEGIPPQLLQVLEGLEPVAVSSLVGLHARTEGMIADADHYTRQFLRYGYPVDYAVSTPDDAWQASGMPQLQDQVSQMVLQRDGKAALAQPLRKAIGATHSLRGQLEQAQREARGAARDRARSVDELRTELENLRAVIDRLESAVARRTATVYNELSGLASAFDEDTKGILTKSSRDLHKTGIREIRRRVKFPASQSDVQAVENVLAWQVRSISDDVEREFFRFRESLRVMLPQLLGDQLDALQDEVGLEADAHLIDATRYVRNLQVPDFDSGAIGTFDDIGFWKTLFAPGAARADLEGKLAEMIDEWKLSRKTALGNYVENVAEQVNERYAVPAMNEVRRLAQVRQVRLVEEIEVKEGRIREETGRDEVLRLESQALAEALAELVPVATQLEDCLSDLTSNGGFQTTEST